VALPVFTLTYVNIRLIQALKARRRKRMEMVSQLQRNDNNVTVVLIIVIIVFIICQIPAFVGFALLNVMSEDVEFCGGYDYYFRPVCNMLLALNTCWPGPWAGAACLKSTVEGKSRREDFPV